MGRKTPQEKKRLSYAKDRRNAYGENDKSSRKSIRRNKRIPHRANRHHDHQILEAVLGAVDELRSGAVEERLYVRRPKRWKKSPDAALGEILQGSIESRVKRGIEDPEVGRRRIRRIRQRQGKATEED
ncbi:hypothetical protein Aph01nite_65670 [Acrocarpospora phusangensis]|uniref:Uncharacterized protein n=1 Tax=Acrocarpospora phusangensis TaxID=1070424 RepID=A0A919QLA0_9ACTN|nr:hypothetical protein [Acrocarpospora phusangensis]GIH28257.1 hypothetical protein Aph01nite_65670 [Acrocarpospora phusangensis]